MAGVCSNMGDKASYKVNAKAFDIDTGNALVFATFGGFSYYVYMMHVDGEGKVDAMTKCWNDAYAFSVMSGCTAPALTPPTQSVAPMIVPDAIEAFFNACESGKGWTECQQHCSKNATFTCQATDALPGPAVTECTSVEAYTNWMAGVCSNMGDKASYKVNAKAFDIDTGNALVFATFGGFSYYVYMMHVDGEGKVDAMTKCWNDAHAFKVMSSAPAAA